MYNHNNKNNRRITRTKMRIKSDSIKGNKNTNNLDYKYDNINKNNNKRDNKNNKNNNSKNDYKKSSNNKDTNTDKITIGGTTTKTS